MVDQSENPALCSATIAAKKLGVSNRTLREYEKKGLIRPFRDPVNGHRLFSDRDLTRVHHLRKLIHQEGLNIASIQRLLTVIPCWKTKNCPKVKKEKCPASTNKTCPCWVIAQDGSIKKTNKCRACKVYREAQKRLS